MCNLYANTIPVAAMRQLFGVTPERDTTGNAEPLPAIFPKGFAPIVGVDPDGARWMAPAQWGFVLPQLSQKTGKPIQPKAVNNARADKLLVSRFWVDSFTHRRCLIPASSFCEAKGMRPATYVWFGLHGETARPAFAFAGIWRKAKGGFGDAADRDVITASMVTTTPNALTRQTHPDRMPMILDAADYQTWLTGSADAAFALIAPFPAERMVIHQSGEGLKSDHGGLAMGI